MKLFVSVRERCWVWMKGNPLKQQGCWSPGWHASKSKLGGYKIEHPDYVTCRVPEWRVTFKEPQDIKTGPLVPEGEDWKLYPLE